MKKRKIDPKSMTLEERAQIRKRNKRFNGILYTVSVLLILVGVYIILNDQTLIIKRMQDAISQKFNEIVFNQTPEPKPTIPPALDTEATMKPLDEDAWIQWLKLNDYSEDTMPPEETPEPTGSSPKPLYDDPKPTPYNPYEPKNIYFYGYDISCPVQPVGYNQQGQMAVVASAYIVGWFRYGGDPVRGGNTIIGGHIRYKGKYGSFSIVRDKLKTGDYVIVELMNGNYAYYVVDRIETHPFNKVPTEIMNTGGKPRLTLITCMDDYNPSIGTSEHRVFALCSPVILDETQQP